MPDLLAGTTILALDTPAVQFAREQQTFDNFTTTGFEPTSPACEVTFLAPTTGRVLIHMFLRCDPDTDGEAVAADVEVRETDGTGTVIHSASETDAGMNGNWPTTTGSWNLPGWRELTGLTAGQTYWAQLQMNVTGTTLDIQDQSLLVMPLS